MFIVLEGGEGSGKSTQAARLASSLGALLTREPGGTTIGERIRAILLDPESDIDARTEALLMAAARAEHVAAVIRPALDAGRVVVCDRFSGSSLAYQGYGRGLPVDELQCVSAWAAGGVAPDLVVLLDVPAGEVARRVADRRPDRFETAGDAFHERVRSGFRELAARAPDIWVVVDGVGPEPEVAARVLAAVKARTAR